MSTQDDAEETHTPRETPQGGRLPYQKPAFRHEGVFETMALACGKISSTQAQCKSLLKLS